MLVNLEKEEVTLLQKALLVLQQNANNSKDLTKEDKLGLTKGIGSVIVKISKNGVPWHDGSKDHPHGENKQCLVLFGIDESGKDCYDVLEWSDKKNAFKVWMDEYNDFRWFPTDNFTKWLYIDDLL